MIKNDYLQRFIFERYNVRGEFVVLNDVYETITTQRDYPTPIKIFLGEAIIAAALLSATIKHKGSLILQTQTTGPISLLVAQCDQSRNVRALAKWENEADFTMPLKLRGQLVVTAFSQNTSDRYQGIINLTEDQLSKNIENYFEQSEQLPTKIWLSVIQDQGIGLLLQKIPNSQLGEQAAGEEWEHWEKVAILANTITDIELHSLDITQILSRLFQEDDIRLFEKESIQFKCSCNKIKMQQAIRLMEKKEIDDILEKNALVEVCCDFCNNCYGFRQDEIDSLFS